MNCPEGCGRCCDPVMLPVGPADLAVHASRTNPRTERWMLHELTPIRRRDGLAATADFLGGRDLADQHGNPVYPHFYRCSLYDPETARCTGYDNRPEPCRDYPLYGAAEVSPAAALPPECVYLPTPRRRPQ